MSRQAIELDNNFAMAHAQIGLLYSVIGESVLAAESTAKAYRLRDRATDRERFFITATYHRQVTGNLEQAQQTFELWARTYPRDITPRALSAGFTYQGSGKYERSIEEATIAIALDPDRAPGYLNAGFSNLYLDRLGEVSTVLQHASEHQLDGPDFQILRYYLAFLKGDQAAMDREFALAAGDAAVEDFMLHSRALALARSGKRGMARIMARRAVDMARAAGQRERAAIFQAGEAVWEAVFGDAPAARRNAAAALELSTGRDVSYAAAFALALAGDISRPQALAADLERRFPEDTSVRLGYLPTLHGLVMLQQGKPAEAIRQLESALPNELAVPALNFVGFYGSLYPAYVRGQAHMAMHRYAEAAAEFRKLVDRPGLVLSDPVESAARLQMARALASAGNTTDAKAAYGELLKRWADADDDLALVKAARAESLKLP